MVIQGVAAPAAATTDGGADAVAEAAAAQDALDEAGAELERALAALHARQDAFEAAVGARAKALRGLPDGRDAATLRIRLAAAGRLTPAAGGWFVEMFLGGLNVRFVRKSERLAFKADYERLKQRLAPMFVVFCIVCLWFEENRWLHMLLQLALTTYYVTLAIRENILLVNGSNIKAWWIVHHYITIVSGVLLLTWPNNATYSRFRNGLHLYGLYNAVLQIFQTRYQIARLYTLRSLGMAGEMDVSNSDSTQIHWSESMKLLLPLIVFGQVLQAAQAFSLLRIYRSSPHELQILLLALLFLILFIGNAVTTSLVLFAKRKSGQSSGSSPRADTVAAASAPFASSHASDGPAATAISTPLASSAPSAVSPPSTLRARGVDSTSALSTPPHR